jgi:antitoxin FitA
MSSLTIRNVDEALKSSLRLRAAAHSRSMEEEVRQILRQALMQELPKIGLGSRIAASFAEIGGVDLTIPARSLPRSPLDFSAEL